MWEPNDLEQQRLDKLARIRQQDINPYPLRVERSHSIAEAVAAFEAAEAATPEGEEIPPSR